MAKRTVNSPSLKAKNGKPIWLLVSTDIVAIVLVLTGFTFTQASLSELAQSEFVRDLLFAAIGPLIATFLNDILPSNAKAIIVFWRIKDALPGHRAFSEHADADPRVNLAALEIIIGEFPQSPRDQNSCWYKLFQKHQSNIIVSDSHERFLLFRDLSSLTLLILVVAWITSALFGATAALQAMIVAALLAQFLWLAISAQNTGIRLVQNVLALESSYDGGTKK